MALSHSPSIVTNGLVFYYDMNNSQKSWLGKPTTNFYTNGHFSNGTGIVQESGSNATNTVIFFPYNPGNSQYVLEQSGGPYTEYQINLSNQLLPSTTYVLSGWYGESIDYVGESRMFHCRAFSSSGAHVALGTGIGTVIKTLVINGITWKYCYDTITTPSDYNNDFNWYLGYGGGSYTGKRYYTNVQMEQGSYPNRFVNGTRYANSNLESSPSYPSWNTLSGSSYSGGTLTFASGSYNSKNGWDLYKTYSGLSTGTNYTWSALVKLGTASNMIITMNNTQAWNTGPSTVVAGLSSTDWTRVAITGTTNTGSFNLHLGASFNTEVASTVQSGGTVFIQDVRLVLSQSQTAISDLMDQNTITAQSLTYNSDGTFNFNGSSNYIDSNPVTLTGTSTQSLTWACWVKPSSGSGDIINMVYPPTGWNMCPIWASGQVFYAKVWSNANLTSGASFNLNQYYYLVLVRDNSTNTNSFYINGQLVASQVGAYSSSGFSNNHYFGRAGSQATNTFFNGQIPVGQIYTRALSAQEVLQNFSSQRGLYGV